MGDPDLPREPPLIPVEIVGGPNDGSTLYVSKLRPELEDHTREPENVMADGKRRVAVYRLSTTDPKPVYLFQRFYYVEDRPGQE